MEFWEPGSVGRRFLPRCETDGKLSQSRIAGALAAHQEAWTGIVRFPGGSGEGAVMGSATRISRSKPWTFREAIFTLSGGGKIMAPVVKPGGNSGWRLVAMPAAR